jgi:hypothetical protein
MGVVTKKSDAWIEVPAETAAGFDHGPIQLRPGANEEKVRIKILGAEEMEVEIENLEAGVALVKQEHSR